MRISDIFPEYIQNSLIYHYSKYTVSVDAHP